jgi:hypothetical protein
MVNFVRKLIGLASCATNGFAEMKLGYGKQKKV